MLAAESWIFGEEWALLVDDQNLDAVLHQHLRRLGPDREAPAATDVRDGEGKTRIVDLILGRSTELAEERHQRLVIELKAPAVTVGPRELEQIENYADAVVNDSQFDLHTTSWDFIVVSSDLHRRAQTRATQKDRPRGLIHEYADANVRIWALTWSQIIRNAEHRMKFVKRNLGYSPTTDHAIDLLRRKHAEFLPGPLVAATDEQPEHLDANPRPLGSDGTHLQQD